MTDTHQRSSAVTAAGVIAILGSIFTAIGSLFSLLALFIASANPHVPGMLPSVRMIAGAVMLAFLCVALFGIVSGVGLIQFRNWARIAALVWSGITAPICLVAMAAMIFLPLPATPTPNSPVPNLLVRLIVVAFYGAPLGVAVWWLILFTRPRIVAQFRALAPVNDGAAGDPFTALPVAVPSDSPTVAPSAFSAAPQSAAYAVAAAPSRPSIPLPIIVLACFFLISAASIFFVFFFHMPAMVFGHAYTGLTGSVIYATWCLLYAVAGIGLLRRLSWAYSVAIAVQILGIVSGIMTVLSPNFDSMVRRAMTNMNLPPPEVYSTPSMSYLRGFSVIGLIFPLAILGLLAYYRPRFMAACAPAIGRSSSQGSSSMPRNSQAQPPTSTIEPAS